MKTAVIAGATGLVGSALLQKLLIAERYSRVVALTRRQLPHEHERLVNILTDFKNLGEALAGCQPDDVFCCLGTTMAKAGTKQKFYQVDFQYPLDLARLTLRLGAKQFHLVSALGASKRSSVYYNRVKGEVEEAVREVGFETVHIFRPSLLLGERDEKRAGEDAAKSLYKFFSFAIPARYKAIPAERVAASMIDSASRELKGVFVHESREMQEK